MQAGAYKLTLDSNANEVDNKDLQAYVYISSFKQNRAEYFTQVFKSELPAPQTPLHPIINNM